MALARINCAWQNWPGAPGVTTFYTQGAPFSTDIDGIRAFFDAIKAYLPTGLTIQVPTSGDMINEADGKITTSWTTVATPAVVTGSNVGTYAGNAGACVHWLTAGVVAGRRVRGRSFLVPLVGAFEANGSLAATPLSTITSAAAALVTAATSLAVWARPFTPEPGDNKPARAGTLHDVIGSRVPDLAVSLRSRRT
jgi:hypothetical protein